LLARFLAFCGFSKAKHLSWQIFWGISRSFYDSDSFTSFCLLPAAAAIAARFPLFQLRQSFAFNLWLRAGSERLAVRIIPIGSA